MAVRMTVGNDFPHDLEAYAAGVVAVLDSAAIETVAHALAVWDGDGRAYREDPDTRDGFAATARLAVGIYLEQVKRSVAPSA